MRICQILLMALALCLVGCDYLDAEPEKPKAAKWDGVWWIADSSFTDCMVAEGGPRAKYEEYRGFIDDPLYQGIKDYDGKVYKVVVSTSYGETIYSSTFFKHKDRCIRDGGQ